MFLFKKKIKFFQVSYDSTGIIPTRADDGSAGHDFYTPVDLEIPPHSVVKFCTNIKAQMPKKYVLKLYVRSSIGMKKNLMLTNGTGIIDSTYFNNPDNEGNIMCGLFNYGDTTQTIKAGERVVQGIFVKYKVASNSKILNKKRIGGIGSSGK